LLWNSTMSFLVRICAFSCLSSQHFNENAIVCAKRMFVVYIIASKQRHWVTAVAVLETEIFYYRHLNNDNSGIRQHFLMQFCADFTEYFRIYFECTNLDRMRSDATFLWYSVFDLHFSGHSVFPVLQTELSQYLKNTPAFNLGLAVITDISVCMGTSHFIWIRPSVA